MMYGTKMLESDIELFTAALSQTHVLVWTLDQFGVYFQVDHGLIVKYSPDHVKVRSENNPVKCILYPRESCEFSIRP